MSTLCENSRYGRNVRDQHELLVVHPSDSHPPGVGAISPEDLKGAPASAGNAIFSFYCLELRQKRLCRLYSNNTLRDVQYSSIKLPLSFLFIQNYCL